MTISGITPPGSLVALVWIVVVAANSVGAAAAAPGAAASLAASAGALAGAAASTVASLAAGCAASLVEVTLVLEAGSSPAGGLSWAEAAKLQATSPTSVVMHSLRFIFLKSYRLPVVKQPGCQRSACLKYAATRV